MIEIVSMVNLVHFQGPDGEVYSGHLCLLDRQLRTQVRQTNKLLRKLSLTPCLLKPGSYANMQGSGMPKSSYLYKI